MGNLLWPGRRALVLQNGWFSGRFAEDGGRRGGGGRRSSCAGRASQSAPSALRSTLENQHYDVVTMVQGETSSGVCTTELPAIAPLVPRARGAGSRRCGLHV